MKRKLERWLGAMLSVIIVVTTSFVTSASTEEVKYQDGTYTATGFTFVKESTGKPGKAEFTLENDQVVVENGVAYVTVVTSSTSMTKAVVGNAEYPVTNQKFTIPTALNTDVTVTVTTIAMSAPSDVPYVMHVTAEVPLAEGQQKPSTPENPDEKEDPDNSDNPDQKEEPDEKEDPDLPTKSYQDGVYTGTGSVPGGKYPTNGYDIDVMVEITDGKISDVRYKDTLPNDGNLTYKKWVMDGCYEWDEESNVWTYIPGTREQAIAKNSAEVDIISRATKTSEAVQTAMKEALEKAESGNQDTDPVVPGESPEKKTVIASEGVYRVTPVVNGLTVVDAVLTSQGGKMTALITLSGTGSDYLYFGTEIEAEEAGGSNMMRYIGTKEYVNASGATKTGYQFLIPIESLDEDIAFISHAKSTNRWFYRTIRFDEGNLEKITWQDGSYTTTATVLDGTSISGDKYPATGYQFLMTVEIQNGTIADVRYAENLPNDGNISYKKWAMDGHYQYETENQTYTWTYVKGIREQAVENNSPQVDIVSTATKVSKAINVGMYTALEKAETGEKDTQTYMPDVVPETENVIADTGTYKVEAAKVETTLGLADTVDVELVSLGGKMMALVTWSSNSGAYDYLYVGTEEEAYLAGTDGLCSPVGEISFTNSSGKEKTGSQFLIPLPSLNKEIQVLAHAKSSNNWFHRTIKICSEDLIPVEDQKDNTDVVILPEGTYSVTVDTGAKMFKVADCKLVVKGETVTAVVTLSSNGYDYLYVGSAADAETVVAEDWSKWIKEIPSGDKTQRVYSVTMSKADLLSGLAIAARSESNQTWYDRNLNFDLESMKVYSVSNSVEDAINGVVSDKAESGTDSGNTGNSNTGSSSNGGTLTEDEIQDKLESVDKGNTVKDGTYTPEFGFTGGSGRATISCSKVVVKNGTATATIVFSSPNFTWVKSLGKTVTNENKGGNSTFTIPINLNGKTTIVAETTAMSQPYEVEYTLYCFIDGTKVTTSTTSKSDDVIELESTTLEETEDTATVTSSWGAFKSETDTGESVGVVSASSNTTLLRVMGITLILICIYAVAATIFAVTKLRKGKGE